MRPDAINWTTWADHLALPLRPRYRMHRMLRRRMLMLVAAQCVLSLLALIILNSPLAVSLGFDAPAIAQIVGLSPTASSAAMVKCFAALLVGSGFAVVGLLPLILWRHARWANALKDIHEGVRRLSQCAQPKPVAVGGDDEVAYLAMAFNDMAGKIMAGRRALVEANEVLEQRVEQRTEELRIANTELDRKNITLAELTDTALKFTDDVAHEFRTPLTVIMEFASIISDGLGGEVTAKQAEYLQFITSASRDLAQLVDDFLDSSKLRAHRLRVDRRVHEVAEILDSAWPMLELRADGNGITLERRLQADLPKVFADIDKARRTLVNLVVNAVKFSKPGGVVTIAVGHGPAGGVEIEVIDRGPGLPPHEVGRLFERFRQGGEGQRSDAKGFGLGLNIVRQLVAANLGTVSVKSAVGQGSTFAFTLPPKDAQTVIEWYLQRVEERSPAYSLSLLRIDRGDGPTDVDELSGFLASATYPNDLAVHSADGTCVLLIGETTEAALWRRKLLRLDQEHRQAHRIEAAAIRVDHLGTWPARAAHDHIIAAVSAHSFAEVHCCV